MQLGAEHYGTEREETMEAHHEGIVIEEMKRRRWGGEERLGSRAKGDVEGCHGSAVASGDGHGEMDSRATANGGAGLRQLSAVTSAKDGWGMSCQYQELTRF